MSTVIERDERKINIDDILDFDKVIRKAGGKNIAEHKNEHPKMICENCGKKFYLLFNPKMHNDCKAIDSVLCPFCRNYAYFAQYYDCRFIAEFYSSEFFYIREMIRLGKIKLLDYVHKRAGERI